nr:MAG TPA: hypothetical protein [Bacteriophage sp.]
MNGITRCPTRFLQSPTHFKFFYSPYLMGIL